jgi:hypothetical protein
MVRTHTLAAAALLVLASLIHPLPSAAQATGSRIAGADARDANLRTYADLLRSDLRGQKAAVIAQMMQLSEEEDAKFWPIYRQYEAGLSKINDERISLIKEYAATFDALTEPNADRLARTALDLEARRQTLKVTYYDQLKSALSAITAAKCLQVENQILLLLDLQIAASLPIIE